MLDVGDRAPDFALTDDEGQTITLDSLVANGRLILYFYPADFTPGCTAEACDIRDLYPQIRESGAEVIGISPQGQASHARFRERHRLPFRLLVDSRKSVIGDFGVAGPLGFGVRRVTYLIGRDKKIEKRVVADFAIKQHTRFVEDVVEGLGGY